MNRKHTNPVQLGSLQVGGMAPISVQSMTNTDTRNIEATVAQIERLLDAGCEIIRLAVIDQDAAAALQSIRARVHAPLVADIHFDYRLALSAIATGVDGIRLNPGNIGERERVKQVVLAAKERGIPIRIGVNSGSLEADLLVKYGHPTAEALVDSALRHVRILEDLDFTALKISVKAANVPSTIEAYTLLSNQVNYPLHLGVTEAGTPSSGTIKSAVGIGSLLAAGIGDTIRVSLTGDPVEEVRVAWGILRSLGLRERGPEVISCPTCGRCAMDLLPIALAVEERVAHLNAPLKIAVMGCAVNGPGEAREADVGIAGGRGEALLFRAGEIVGKVQEEELVDVLVREAEEIARTKYS